MPTLAGRTAIVTGSSSGIGQGIAERLAREGANVVIDYVGHSDGADTTLKKVEAAGSKGILVQVDLSKPGDVRNLVDRAWKAFGAADILVNNAGIERKSDFRAVSEQCRMLRDSWRFWLRMRRLTSTVLRW
jgi:glucose 1-dehydrogenase